MQIIITSSGSGVKIIAPNQAEAIALYEKYSDRLQILAEEWGEASVVWQGCRFGLRKFAKDYPILMESKIMGLITTNRIEGIAPPSLDELNLTEFYQSPYPVYITSLEDQSVLFLNPAALRSQGRKPSELHLINGYSLNFEDELQARDRFIRRDGELTEYCYQALRWYQTEEGMWLRQKMDFCSNFKKVDYLNVPCRLSVILEAVPA